MSRDLSGGVTVNLEDDVIFPFFAVELNFDDGTFEAADGNPVYQGIDQSKLVPLLVATIQELEARITALENA